MAKSVPTKSSLLSAGKTGGIDGTTLALGEVLGRALLGPGPGTAVGGIAAAATERGSTRDMMATIAVERGMTELARRAL